MFQGSLDTVSIEDVFQLFSFSRKSGALHLRKGGDRGVVYFLDGAIYYASAHASEGIGSILVKADIVTPEQWRQVLSKARGDTTQGEALLDLPEVDSDQLEAFIKERVEDAVFRLMQWDKGEFQLKEESHPLGPLWTFDTAELIEEGKRRLDEWGAIAERIPSTSMGVALNRELAPGVEGVTISREEWRVVASLQPGVSIRELAAAIGETEFAICETLVTLVDNEIIELINEDKLAVIRKLVGTQAGDPFETEADAVFDDETAEEAAATTAVEPSMSFAELAAQAEADETGTKPKKRGSSKAVAADEASDEVEKADDSADDAEAISAEELAAAMEHGDIDAQVAEGMIGADLDKSLVLRLIAGVKNL